MTVWTIHTFTTRGSTCPSYRYRLMRDGKKTTTEFGNFRDAKHYCALRNLREYMAANRVVLDMDENEIAAKLIVLDA